MIYFTKDHEWIEVDGNIGTIGISPHAIEQLGDVIFVELPVDDLIVVAGDAVAVFESVKAASDIYSPVSGIITEVNEQLVDNVASITPETARESWLYKIKISNHDELNKLMDEAAYNALIAG